MKRMKKQKKRKTKSNSESWGRIYSFQNFVSVPKRLILEYSDWIKKAGE
jgi:hypothetical protein